MEFRVLGPVRAARAGRDIPLGRRRERLLLGLLLLEPGRIVSADRLAGLLWSDRPDPGSRHQLRVAVSRLRACLAEQPDVRIESGHGGYAIKVDPAAVDASVFQAEVATAATITDAAERLAVLRRALARWEGPLFADVAGPELRARVGGDLEEARLAAREARLAAEMAVAGPAAVLAELIDLTSAYPLREPLAALLMRAQFRLGRLADAIRGYRELHQRLAEDLGTGPGPQTRALFEAILRADAAVATPSEPGRPADIATFTGRTAELAELDGWLRGPATAPPIGVIVGLPGVGKTTLAARWALRAAGRFPDGQLWVNLRGHGPGRPLGTAAALAHLLDALGVEPARIPHDVDEATALYRSEIAHRRMLVMLDNARSAEQVRPLLPGAAGCAVVVTSRQRLTDLVARHGARRLSLGGLEDHDAVALLARIAGPERLAAEPAATRELATLTAGNPLALCLCAAHLAENSDRHITLIRDGLLLHQGADPSPVRAAFDQSYTHLDPRQREMFAAIGLHPGRTVDRPAAAAMLDTDVTEADRVLAALRRAHLVTPAGGGRVEIHDLLHSYAAEQAAEIEPAGRRATLLRLYAHELAAVDAAVTGAGPAPDAEAWLADECANLVDLAGLAAESTDPDLAGHLVALGQILSPWFVRTGRHVDRDEFYRYAFPPAPEPLA